MPPKKVPYFKPGKELKELINREPERAAAGRRPDAGDRDVARADLARIIAAYGSSLEPVASRLHHR